jgi:RNA polymerase sigma-70 factor (ECF subfamily)
MTDEELLAASRTDAQAFGLFYDRHVHAVAGYFAVRTRCADVAADLTAETFAAALAGRKRFDARKGPAAGWLFGIARRKLADAYERGRVEDRARRRLGMARIEVDDDALERVLALAAAAADGARVVAALDDLPAEQREAVNARVVQGDEYADIAARLHCSESVVRKRVSRGLAGLRGRLEEST